VKRSHKVLIGAAVLFVGVIVIAGVEGASTPTLDGSTPASSATAAAATTDAGPDREYCQMSSDGGTYILQVASAAAHDFSICAGGKVDDSFDLEKALSSGWDRRCLTTTGDQVTAVNADVGVYSDSKRADVAAAKAFCTSEGWSNS
jgi:hypothetical protein